MSIEVSKFYWDRCAGIKDSALLVVMALADYSNESGWCFPSVAELARRCRLSDRGTQKILRRLAAGGHIAVETNEGMRKARGSPTHKYHLLAYQHSLRGAKGEQIGAPLAVEKDEQIGSPLVAEKDERICSPNVPEKGEHTGQKGEPTGQKGEPASSPDPYRSIKDPNTTAARVSPTDYQKVVKAYHDEIGTLTPIVEEEIKEELVRSSAEWVIRAIGIAAMRSKRRWAYVAGILRRWHADGFDGDGDRTPGSAGSKQGSNTGSKSMGYGRQMAPAAPFKGQSIEDYADDPEYYAQLQELYAGGAGAPPAGV